MESYGKLQEVLKQRNREFAGDQAGKCRIGRQKFDPVVDAGADQTPGGHSDLAKKRSGRNTSLEVRFGPTRDTAGPDKSEIAGAELMQ